MSISATIIKDSITKEGKRLTTFELVLPKQLLAQLNTHRSLSKNAASSRAIPIKKFMESIKENPVLPVWTENKPGMVGDKITDKLKIALLNTVWLAARDTMIGYVGILSALGVHKQTANRLLEPWFYAKIVCSATDLDWFFQLRDSGSAQEEIAILARAMKDALSVSTPTLLSAYEWHIPYILPEEEELQTEVKLKISVARCARTSYHTFDNEKVSTVEKDLALYEQLFSEKHLSPFEHQAQVPSISGYKSGNFNGWKQNRELVL